MQFSTPLRALAGSVGLTAVAVVIAVSVTSPETPTSTSGPAVSPSQHGVTRGGSSPENPNSFDSDRTFPGLSDAASAPLYNPFDPNAGPPPGAGEADHPSAESDSNPDERPAEQQFDAASPSAAPDESTTGERDDLAASMERFRSSQRQLRRQAAAHQRSLVAAAQPEPSSPVHVFRVASYNVLGASHTGEHGHRKGFPDADARMSMTIAALRSNAVDVVGFQEFERTQHDMFTTRASEYALYPGLSKGERSVRFNLAWRTSMWRLVEAHTIAVPYAGGNRIEMPVVLLESTATGRRAWFANFHNPADTPRLGNNARWRAEGTGIELAHLSQLHADTGYPVIVTGDFNERAEIFCRFTGTGVFHAAAGGSTVDGCVPPPNMRVDWIFGSSDVTFAGYAITGTGKASDHDLVHAQATLN